MLRRSIALCLLLAGLLLPAAATAASAQILAPIAFQPAVAAETGLAHELFVPTNAASRQPLRVLVAMHAMGGDGRQFGTPLLAEAERQGWVVLAPSIGYGDWRDPEQVRLDDTYFLPRIKSLLDGLPARTGLQLRQRALLYGFSRGGQLAHRFASFYPGSTLGVASFSGGTFTLPYTRSPDGRNLPLNFPYGLADLQRYTGQPLDIEALRRVSFMIGVGANDNQPGDLPRQWDPYLGANRVERAQAYFRALESLGVPAQLTLFPDATHAENDDMRRHALSYLASLAP